MIEDKTQETRSIKLNVLNIMKETIEAKANTLTKIDGKIGILIGFYFLAFIQIVDYIKDYRICLFVLYLIFFGRSTYFLVRNFWLKDVEHLYPNLEIYLPHQGNLTYEGKNGYIESLSSHYKKIEKSLDDTLKKRRNNLKISIISFCISLLIFTISISIKIPNHFGRFGGL